MNHAWNRRILVTAIAIASAGCVSNPPVSMVHTYKDPATGKIESKTYSKFYQVADWLDTAKLGVHLVIDHEKPGSSAARSVPAAPGMETLSSAMAAGVATLYLVNLEQVDRTLELLSLSSDLSPQALAQPRRLTANARARTQVRLLALPIDGYGTEIKVVAKFKLDGEVITKVWKVERQTEAQIRRDFAPGAVPPYPWFAAPYYPFNPPLRMVD